MRRPKLIRITTVSLSIDKLLSGQLAFMNNFFEVIAIASGEEYLKNIGVKENIDIFHLKMTRQITPFQDLKAIWELHKWLRVEKPDIIHTHTPKAGFVGMLSSRFSGIPIRIHTVAGLPLMEAKGFKRALLNIVEKLTYACATKVYPNSGNLKDFILKQKFCKSEKLKVIGNGSSNGIDTNVFKRTEEINFVVKQLLDQHQLSLENFIFIFIGRLVKDKGIEELIQAFSQLSESYPDIRLLLVGPEEPDLDPLSVKCIKEINQNQAIIHVGYQDDVKPYLAMSNVLTFPSYREGFPNVPMQAGCFDLPSIVTNINGCNEIIIDGENGIIIPVKNAEALKIAMERLYLDKHLYKKMSLSAREMIVSRYEQYKVWELILEEYKGHLDRKGIVYKDI